MATFKRGTFYHYEFQFKGRRYRASTKQRTKKDADKVEAKVRERVEHEDAGIVIPRAEDSPRFVDWAVIYLAHAHREMTRPERVEGLLRVVLRFWGAKPKDPAFHPRPGEDAPFHDIRLLDPIHDPSWLLKFDAWMRARGVRAHTRAQYISTCSEMYRFAMKPEHRKRLGITSNPFDGITREKGGRSTFTFTTEQLTATLAAASYHVRLAVTIAVLAPKLRKANILGLKWGEHIDPELRYITVHQHKTASKTRKPLVMPISAQLRAVLQDARQRNRGSKYVVTYRSKRVKDVRDGLEAAMTQAGVPYGRYTGGTFHSLRHTANTLMAELEVDPRKQQQVAGHQNLETTMLYTHLRPTVEAPVLEQLSAALPLMELATRPGRRASRKQAVGESEGTLPPPSQNRPMNPASNITATTGQS